MNKDRKITERFVRHAEKRGIKGLFITVDAPQLGRREKVPHLTRYVYLCNDALVSFQDMRQKFEAEEPDEMNKNEQHADRSQGAARAISVSRDFAYHGTKC